MKLRVLFAVWTAACALFTNLALGQPADALKKAQAAFDQAQIDYIQGKFDEAAKGFEVAYQNRDFSQFLFNIGACHHMKGKKSSDPAEYQAAVDFYKKYLEKEPKAPDKAKVEKAIGVLEAEIKRLKETPATPPDPANPATTTTAPATPSKEVEQLGEVKPAGLVVIESQPSNATIYLDGDTKKPFGQTPWSGTLEGAHTYVIEKRGSAVMDGQFAADPNKLVLVAVSLGKQDTLGWVDITSNVAGADVYLDDKSVGAIGKTPLGKHFKPGKHTFIITTEGYDEYKQEITVEAGNTHEVKASLKGSPVGRLDVRGLGIEDSTIYVDGKVACERGPCLKSLQQGEHTVTVTRSGMKTYSKRVLIQAKTETTIKVGLAPKPSRTDAVVAYILAAGFGGGGVFLGLKANGLRDDLRKEIDAGNPPPDSNDPRYTKGKIFAIAADASFVLAGITGLTAIYYTFRDKGAPSTGLVDVRALALQPQVGPGYAGLGMEVRW